jgi:Alpha/beta hydrolase of unknown function (DUF900)
VTWFLDLRANPVGGGVRPDILIYDEGAPKLVPDLKEAIRNQGLFFAVHGFNVTAAWGRSTLSAWAGWQSLPAGTVYIAVLWPGDSSWAHGLDYPVEGNDAMASGNLLASFISNYLTEAASLSFASHSLGARVVLQTITKLARPVRRVMLMAAAIDDTALAGEYSAAVKWVDKISVLASREDTVLEYAFPLGNLASGIISRGSPYWHAALGREGPQSGVQGKVIPGWQMPDGWAFDHHDYLPSSPPVPPPIPVPMQFPRANDPLPPYSGGLNEWRPAWSAAITSTRFE